MGKTSAELQREIAEYRTRMESRVRHLEDRVRSDVRDAGSTVKHDITDRANVKHYVEERPLTALLGAFGAGVALGIASDKAPKVRRGARGRRGRRSAQGDGDGGGGLFDELLATFSGTMSGSLRGEVKGLVDDLFGRERRGGAGSSVTGDGRYQEPQRRDTGDHPYDPYAREDGGGGAGSAPFTAGTGDYRFAPGDTADWASRESPTDDYDTSPYADDEALNEYGLDPALERPDRRPRRRSA